jgi:uncharacterized protein (DUF2249 family)
MSDAGNARSDTEERGASKVSLHDEHAMLVREVTMRAQAVTAEADQGSWPQAQLRELLNYLHLEVLRQLVDEEWLLFRVVRHAPGELDRLSRDHLEIRLAIEVLDQAAANGGSPDGLSLQQLSATTRDLLALLERHLAAESGLAIAGQVAPATASLGAQPHEWYALTEGPVIELDKLPGEQGADAALARLLRLQPTERVEISSSGDPSPLWQRLFASDPGGYGIEYLERGPKQWRVEITRRPPHSQPQPYA